jgi:hypothetical protein
MIQTECSIPELFLRPLQMISLRVWVKVHQILGLPEAKYRVCGDVNPFGIPFSSPCEYDTSSSITRATNAVELSAGRRYGSLLVITVKRNFFPSREVARLSLPLDWFPADRTVRAWFPMKSNVKVDPPIVSADVEVHIIKRHVLPPFTAEPGGLLVLPAWHQPDCPAVAPVPYFPPIPGYVRASIIPAPDVHVPVCPMVPANPSEYGFIEPSPPSVTPVWLDPNGE